MNRKSVLNFVLAAALMSAGCSGGEKVSRGNLFNDVTFNFEALRVLQYAVSGGSEINEVLDTVANIKDGDFDSWVSAWSERAATSEHYAQNSSDTASSAGHYARAHNYYRSAEFFISHDDPRKAELVRKTGETFYKSLDLQKIDYTRLEVPYGGTTLSAVYYQSQSSARKNRLLIGVCGFDSIQEELYFMYVKEALARGYDVLTYDGPGQGSSIRIKKILFTHEWEKPNGAVIDYFLAKYEKPEKLFLIGNSLGTMLVTRAAAFDSRVDGIVCFDVLYDFGEMALWDFPESTKKMVAEYPEKKVAPIAEKISEYIMHRDPKIRWAMNHGKWVFGVKSDIEVLKEYYKFTIKDIAKDVRCDVLLLAATEDHAVPFEFLEKSDKALTNARSIKKVAFDRDSGGYRHCQVGGLEVFHEALFGWLDSLK